jgi:hypothetical protein
VAVAPGARRSDATSGAARRGIHSRACLEAAHSHDLLLLSDLEGEGVGSPEEDSIGAVVEGRIGRTMPDPDKAGIEEISRKLAGQLATQIDQCLPSAVHGGRGVPKGSP